MGGLTSAPSFRDRELHLRFAFTLLLILPSQLDGTMRLCHALEQSSGYRAPLTSAVKESILWSATGIYGIAAASC